MDKKKWLDYSGMSDYQFNGLVDDGIIEVIKKGRNVYVNEALLKKKCEQGLNNLNAQSNNTVPSLKAIN